MSSWSRVMVGVIVGVFASCASAQTARESAGRAKAGSAYAAPPNFYGAHLLVADGAEGTRGHKHLLWARHLVGRWGHAKTLLGGIDQDTKGPRRGWIDYVQRCYQLELIPFLRLAGHYREGGWAKPEADAPGDYASMAAAVKRVVEGIPRSDLCPLYVEIWNEPNLAVEWSGKPNPEEYAAFFVQVAAAIRSIGDERIRILNGGPALGPDWTEKMCQADPAFIRAFDVWSSHPYPMNRPPHLNHHNKNVPPDSHFAIDAHLLELDVLKRLGRADVPVMITETGYDLGNGTYTRGEGHPIIDEENRADYIVRAFRDYWPQWKEVVAVFPFEFCNEGWERFDWVYPDSDTNPDGSPTRPHYQYTAVAALAKPTDPTGAISGTVTAAKIGSRLEGAEIQYGRNKTRSDSMGNYFLPRLAPGDYTLVVGRDGFTSVEHKLEVAAGRNTVFDPALEATALGRLGGVVRSGDDDKTLASVIVRLEPGGLTGRTDSAGRYQFRDVIPARYTLMAEAKRRHPYHSRAVAVGAKRETEHDFRLGRQQCPDTENLANNPSMEAGGGGGGKPGVALGFEPPNLSAYRGGSAEISDAEAHTGRRSQRLRVRSGDPTQPIIRQITHYGTIEPGKHYVIGIWIKAECSDGRDGASITFDFTDNGGAIVRRVAGAKEVTGQSKAWVYVALDGQAPPGSQRLSLNLHVRGSGGYAYFDDAFIGEAPERR